MKLGLIFSVIALVLTAEACSGDVKVTGIPESIELQAPFCVPAPVDAGDQ